MNAQNRLRLVMGLAVGLFLTDAAQGAVRPNGLFSDNGVLQQKVKVPVWGTTDKTEKITVRIANQEAEAVPKDGKWKVELGQMPAGGPHVMTIGQGDDKIELKNILVGEVWLCGGQSNMQWQLKNSDGGSEAITDSANDKLRLLTVPRHRSDTPKSIVDSRWEIAGPQTTGEFSAVGYFFGRDLQKHLGVPVGLISSNVGGTAAEEWTSQKALESNPDLKGTFTPAEGSSRLYNAMIAPLAPYAIQGAIWYQGESNAPRAFHYRKLLPAMIADWRNTFGQGDFPFLIVQIAPYDKEQSKSPDSRWAEIRDSQLHVSQNVPRSALVVTIDVGDEQDIHPRRKEPVGARLALAARGVAYGENIEFSGPIYDSMSVLDNKVRLRFKHLGSGLVAKADSLLGFTVAGEDQKFHPANAEIEGDTVVVSSDQVQKPLAVRYAWLPYPEGNLWNRDDLPASPFRTDSFPLTTQDQK
ncbi:MAG: sialate O-acetylesterase [Pirellulales bacterium]